MKCLIFLLVFYFTLSSHTHAESCGSDLELKNKINYLKLEVACTGSRSIGTCAELMANFSPEVESHVEKQVHNETSENNCNSHFTSSLPLSLSIHSLVNHVNKVNTSNSQLVGSLEEFYEHIRLHRERVKILGLELIKTHPELFQGLTAKNVEALLEAHDLAKVHPGQTGADGRAFYRILFDSYGRELDKVVVEALNSKDVAIMDLVKANHGLENNLDLQNKIDRIEKIADQVDRGLSHVSSEEFGRPMEKASTYLKNESDQKLALELEKKYFELTRQHTYKKLTPLQIKSIASKIKLEELFFKLKNNSNTLGLSARLLAHSLLSRGANFMASFFEVLASKNVSLGLKVLNVPMLYFASMDSLGCAGRGYHDWIKDPHCKPVVDLSPKVLDFLNEPWDIQKKSLESMGNTCTVIDQIYKKSITAPKVVKCSDKDIEIELPGGLHFTVVTNKDRQLREIIFNDLAPLTGVKFYGKVSHAKVSGSGKIEEVCYSGYTRFESSKKCLNPEVDKVTTIATELIYGLNYQIQKAIACCRKSNPDLNLICLK